MHFLIDLFLFRFVGLDSICEEFRELGIWVEKYRLCLKHERGVLKKGI